MAGKCPGHFPATSARPRCRARSKARAKRLTRSTRRLPLPAARDCGNFRRKSLPIRDLATVFPAKAMASLAPAYIIRYSRPGTWRKHVNDQSRLDTMSRYPEGGDRLYIVRGGNPERGTQALAACRSPKSFHGAIIGNAENHRHVTAYDVAIGGGKASSDPRFYEYLCAVADWRLQKDIKASLNGKSYCDGNNFLRNFLFLLGCRTSRITQGAHRRQRRLLQLGSATSFPFLHCKQDCLQLLCVKQSAGGRTESFLPQPLTRRAINDIPK